MIFRQLFDPQSSTYTYLLADSAHARGGADRLRVRPRPARRGADRGARPEAAVHARYARACRPRHRRLAAQGAPGLEDRRCRRTAVPRAPTGTSSDGDRISFGKHTLEARATPGHTGGCMTYVLDDGAMAFTGDALLIRGCGRTDFQQGDARSACSARCASASSRCPTTACSIPRHDYRGLTASSVGEEKLYNPRLAESVGEDDFVGYMTHLGLPHPKQMDVAVPANLRCGKPEKERRRIRRGAGLGAAVLHLRRHLGAAAQLAGGAPRPRADGRRARARRVQRRARPHRRARSSFRWARSSQQVAELNKHKPIVAVCRSGARSAQATVLLGNAGFDQVANLAGGMLRWRSQRFPVAGGTDYVSVPLLGLSLQEFLKQATEKPSQPQGARAPGDDCRFRPGTSRIRRKADPARALKRPSRRKSSCLRAARARSRCSPRRPPCRSSGRARGRRGGTRRSRPRPARRSARTASSSPRRA